MTFEEGVAQREAGVQAQEALASILEATTELAAFLIRPPMLADLDATSSATKWFCCSTPRYEAART